MAALSSGADEKEIPARRGAVNPVSFQRKVTATGVCLLDQSCTRQGWLLQHLRIEGGFDD